MKRFDDDAYNFSPAGKLARDVSPETRFFLAALSCAQTDARAQVRCGKYEALEWLEDTGALIANAIMPDGGWWVEHWCERFRSYWNIKHNEGER